VTVYGLAIELSAKSPYNAIQSPGSGLAMGDETGFLGSHDRRQPQGGLLDHRHKNRHEACVGRDIPPECRSS
jgi:hypothetical protein